MIYTPADTRNKNLVTVALYHPKTYHYSGYYHRANFRQTQHDILPFFSTSVQSTRNPFFFNMSFVTWFTLGNKACES